MIWRSKYNIPKAIFYLRKGGNTPNTRTTLVLDSLGPESSDSLTAWEELMSAAWDAEGQKSRALSARSMYALRLRGSKYLSSFVLPTYSASPLASPKRTHESETNKFVQ